LETIMIRMSKLTDYGVALMTHLAREDVAGSCTARDLAEELGLPLPTVSKLLKRLARMELLHSQRGVKGGYSLARDPVAITVADLIGALEGPIAMTACTDEGAGQCNIEPICGVRHNWHWINKRILEALQGITLADMSGNLAQPAASAGLLTVQNEVESNSPQG
jgi:FeS assembly SUF system regulator